MNSRVKGQVQKALLSGDAILVTGAGFSRAARDSSGDQLPLGRELAMQLWPIAFGDEDFDTNSTLGEIYRLANRKAGGLLRQHLEAVFRVDPKTIPERYTEWFAMPWHRIYTLNIDDLDEKVAAKSSGVSLKVLSAASSSPSFDSTGQTAVVHLNGRLSDFPDLTFDAPTYGARTAMNDPWYQEFIADIVSRPTVFIGTVLDETPLWHYLSQRGAKSGQHEQRPRSFLVSPSLSASRRELLAEFNIHLIEADERAFYEQVIQPILEQTHAAAERKKQASRPGSSYLQSVASIVAVSPAGDADFLLGREPHWGDVISGVAAEFDFDLNFIEAIRAMSDGFLLLHGVAASGKSTTLMRAATVLSAEGNKVTWLSRDTAREIQDIRKDAVDLQPDFLFIDDLDRFADAGINLIQNLMRDCPTTVLIGSMRTPRMNQLEYQNRISSAIFLSPPDLTDEDAGQLVDALERGNRLGQLLGLPRHAQIKAITSRANRQLLVSLLEATSGQKLHDKVGTECAQLTGLQKEAYGVLCASIAADNQYLHREDVLIAINSSNNEGLNAINALVQGHLVIADGNRLRPRHRVIAESVVDYLKAEGQLRGIFERLLTLFAIRNDPSSSRTGRYRRLLIRFLGHDFLKEQLGGTVETQLLYGAVESTLASDFHFWLQRGSIEVESGSLDTARVFLAQAQILAPTDRLVETEWCYMLLKQALAAPDRPGSGAVAEEGLRRLEALMQSTFRRPHMYHIYLTRGLTWLTSGNMTNQEKRDLRERLRTFADKAAYLFPTNDILAEAKFKLERTLLTFFIPSS